MARVLAISSHVVRGQVGLCASVPALQWLGHEVWALPTILLASRPGLGRLVKRELSGSDLGTMLAGLEADGCWASLDAVLTGYFPSAPAVAVAAETIARIRAIRPNVTVLVDPIIGDAGALYVPQQVAEAIRRDLLPLATIAAPNHFELEWLAGRPLHDATQITEAARQLGPSTVVVTSARATDNTIATQLVTPDECLERDSPKRDHIPNGPGDLLAGLMLGNVLNALTTTEALEASLVALDRVLAGSSGASVLAVARLWADKA